jgi:4-amino-4-deoxy-L-arabinose transferase-like glycosyltransferase
MSREKLSHKKAQKLFLKIFFWIIFITIILFLLLYRLNTWPSLWWDEGWTLSAARNWIEHGHLGNYLVGQPIPPRIPLRFPVVVPVALSMKLFGIGTWQGRLPGIILTIMSLVLVGYISMKMFTKKVAVATIASIFCLSVYIYNPLVIGRQVMAEMPMMFYLLGGYFLVWLALTKSTKWGIGAALLFGIAIHAKLQVPPFWVASLILAIVIAALLNQRRIAILLSVIACGSIFIAGIVLLIQNLIMPGSFESVELVKILFNSVIVVFNWKIRKSALTQILLFGLPALLGYIWGGCKVFQYVRKNRRAEINQINMSEVNTVIMRTAIWGLGMSWFIWYAVFAIDWIRYFFPPFFIGSIFISAYLDELTREYQLRLLVKRSSTLILKREFNQINIHSFILILSLSVNLATAIATDKIGLSNPQDNPNLAASYLVNHIPPGAVVETFESELYFLAPNIKYHFPSDLVSIQAQRKTTIDPLYVIDYDPMQANPDYLVVGYMGHLWPLYNDLIDRGIFSLQADIGGYQIYRRIFQ